MKDPKRCHTYTSRRLRKEFMLLLDNKYLFPLSSLSLSFTEDKVNIVWMERALTAPDDLIELSWWKSEKSTNIQSKNFHKIH